MRLFLVKWTLQAICVQYGLHFLVSDVLMFWHLVTNTAPNLLFAPPALIVGLIVLSGFLHMFQTWIIKILWGVLEQQSIVIQELCLYTVKITQISWKTGAAYVLVNKDTAIDQFSFFVPISEHWDKSDIETFLELFEGYQLLHNSSCLWVGTGDVSFCVSTESFCRTRSSAWYNCLYIIGCMQAVKMMSFLIFPLLLTNSKRGILHQIQTVRSTCCGYEFTYRSIYSCLLNDDFLLII